MCYPISSLSLSFSLPCAGHLWFSKCSLISPRYLLNRASFLTAYVSQQSRCAFFVYFSHYKSRASIRNTPYLKDSIKQSPAAHFQVCKHQRATVPIYVTSPHSVLSLEPLFSFALPPRTPFLRLCSQLVFHDSLRSILFTMKQSQKCCPALTIINCDSGTNLNL